MKKESRTIHQPRVELPEGNRAVVDPIYRSVKFTFPTIADSRAPDGFHYTRGGNPTTRQLEILLAELQQAEDGLVVGSGMAAVSICLLANLRAGDHMVIFVESYKPSRSLVRTFLPRFGITHSMQSIHDFAAMERVFSWPETRLVFFEAPTNPMLSIPDIQQLIELAGRHEVVTVLDNTFAGFHNHGQFPVDYWVHSLTKYANGHGDVMGGVVLADTANLKPLRSAAGVLGPVLDPDAAFMILRGLKTYWIRYRQQCSNAQRLAEFLNDDPRVERVYYPGLVNDPSHQLAEQQMQDFGAVLSFDLGTEAQATFAFIDALSMFTTCASLGSTESLVAPVKLYWANDLDDEELGQAHITDGTVRLAVGLEHPDDLIADLDHALATIGGR